MNEEDVIGKEFGVLNILESLFCQGGMGGYKRGYRVEREGQEQLCGFKFYIVYIREMFFNRCKCVIYIFVEYQVNVYQINKILESKRLEDTRFYFFLMERERKYLFLGNC